MGSIRHGIGKSQGPTDQVSTSDLQDQVYRAMLRLEVDKPNAASELCECLSRAWRHAQAVGEPKALQRWLTRITPICLELLTNKVARIEAQHG